MQKQKKIKLFSVLLAVLLVSACGYQLRQAFILPEQYTPVQIQVPREYRQLRAAIEEQLKLSFVDVAEPGEAAGLLIRLAEVEGLNELLTASAEGTPLERELSLRASVRWVDAQGDAQGQELIEAETFRLRRAYSYDDQAILAKEREANFLMDELERDLAQRIVVRLRQLSQK